jgi:hypothetical protein
VVQNFASVSSRSPLDPLRSGCVGPTPDCEIGFLSSVRKSTHVIDLAPVSLVCGRASDTSKTSKESFGKSIQRISRYPSFLVDNPTARGGLKAKEILHGCQIRNVNPFGETASPGAILVGDREPLLDSSPSRFFGLLPLPPPCIFTWMAREKVTAEELLAQARSKGYKRGGPSGRGLQTRPVKVY